MADLQRYASRAWRTYRNLQRAKRTAEVTGAVVLGAAALGVAAGVAKTIVKARRGLDLNGKVVLLTGGSRGLGLILARLLTAEGARVALCARDIDELNEAKQDLIGRGAPSQNVWVHTCDVTRPEQIKETVDAVRAHFGPIDILINNAGTIQVGPLETQTTEDYDEAMKTHFWGPYHFVQAVVANMKARGAGRIVNVSSIGGLVSVPHMLPYSASKSALVSFSEGLRAELLKDGIYVTTVCPGLIRTGSPDNAYFKGQHRAEHAWFTLGDSLPGTSQSADAAAKQIVGALKSGEAMLVTSFVAQAASLVHGIFPGVTADALGLVNRLLPRAEGPGNIGTERRTGAESETPLTEGPLTVLTRKAARDNNQDNNQEVGQNGSIVSEPALTG